jgi:hypothetical protein
MWPALNPFTALAYCVTVLCLTALALVLVALRGTDPTHRPTILRSLAHVVRAWAEVLRFWRR